jgi:ABC-2 type transport system ATP-binding protein
VIEITDLYKYYGERKAIGPLSFSIAAGEIVGLLGLNGAGKTTTLRILACDLLPSGGTVRVDGLDVVDEPHEVRQRIGYLPDRPPLYEDMSVHDYLVFAARLRGVPAADAARAPARRGADADERREGRSDRTRSPTATNSAWGSRRPSCIGRGSSCSTSRSAGLDPVQIVEMRNLLLSLKEKHTILLSSHILSEISETCDRILVIKDGRIAAGGTEAELSAKLLRGAEVEITVRYDESESAGTEGGKARQIVEKIDGVRKVELLPQAEPGERVVSLRVEAERDVREALCKALIDAGIGILQVRAGERELESVFLSLAGSSSREAKKTAAARAAGRPKGVVKMSAPKGSADADEEET